MLFALCVTASLLGLLLLIPRAAERIVPEAETLVVLSLPEPPDRVIPPPQEKPVNQAEVEAESREEAAPASRPRTAASAPAVPVIPSPLINLAPVELPQVPVTGDALGGVGQAEGRGDLAQGPTGPGGKGGNGLGGDGSGGAGSGRGTGNRLFASWAPDMDFSQNYRFYPREARLAGIEGKAWLRCFVLPGDRVRDCQVVAERPVGHGFGAAALKTEPGMRVRVRNQAGRRIFNVCVTIDSRFVLPKGMDRAAATDGAKSGDQPQP
ncbi:MAG: hypothetical protein ACKO01_04330 [Erythrobacter sp.]